MMICLWGRMKNDTRVAMEGGCDELGAIKILLGDLAYFNRYTRSSLYTPLAAGFIATYVKSLFGDEVDVRIIKDPEEFLAYANETKPDIIGLSLYYWNTHLNHAVIKKIRNRYGRDPIIVYGGPSVDTDCGEQQRLFKRFPEVDALVPDEGELGFANLVRAVLADRPHLWQEPLDGVVFRAGAQLVSGRPVGLTLELGTLGSPYLNGFLDAYLHGDFQPLVQTSRLCPYTCAFCVSGKTRGKIRAFPIEQVKEELKFVASHFKDRPHFTCFIADENFGILDRDVEIAECIKACSLELGYPQNVFFYNDKRFTKTSRAVIERLGDINTIGLTLALQTENPEALKAIHRTNLTSEQIDAAIAWAAQRDISTTTEIIFGLPYETAQTFVDLLERSVRRGFDSVLCHNLFVMDGIEMNRPAYRERHRMQTRHRILTSSYGMIDGEFTVESEEVVTATSHFTFEDFSLIRCLNFMFYTVYTLSFHKFFFNYLRQIDVSLTDYFTAFMNPDPHQEWPAGYLRFIQDFKDAYQTEIFSTRGELVSHAREIYVNNGHAITEPSRINVRFGARLIYIEGSWMTSVLKQILCQFYNGERDSEFEARVDLLLSVGKTERIPLIDATLPEPVMMNCDLIQWREDKFRTALTDLKMIPTRLIFKLVPDIESRIRVFNRDFGDEAPEDYYYHALDFFGHRRNLLYHLCHEESPVSLTS